MSKQPAPVDIEGVKASILEARNAYEALI